MKRARRTVLMTALMAGVLGSISMSGCYREVISADGIGADQSYPRRAKSSEPRIDKAIDDLFEEKKN